MAAILLDISRTISRAPYPHPTGIDRVERAYILRFLEIDEPVWFLSKVLKGYALLSKDSMRAIWPMITGAEDWQKSDLIARLFSHKLPKAVNQAESTLRRMAQATCLRPRLAKMLRHNLPHGFTYLNVGHSNRKAAFWQAVSKGGAGQKLAMVHDVIPLDYPEFTRPDTAARFESELKATAAACDTLIYNSTDTAERTADWLRKWEIRVGSLTNLLGVDPLPMQVEKPQAVPAEFVILGTIEPRKNHQLLLDIWPEISGHLHIIGARGWQNEAVFSTLDSSPMIGQTVFEHNKLNDAKLGMRLSASRALLFPSFAEGYGYPLIESLQMGLPVICSDLPCFREIAGDLPTYLPPNDHAAWKAAILASATTPREKIPDNVSFPTWNHHFAKLEEVLYKADTQHAQKVEE